MDVGAAPGCRRGKPRGVLPCHGTRRVTSKPLHGAGACVVPRCQGPRSGAPPRARMDRARDSPRPRPACTPPPRAHGPSTAARGPGGRAAVRASDSHRRSDDAVARRLARVTGPPVLRAQTLPPLGVAQAAAVRPPWPRARQAATAVPASPAGTPQGDGEAPPRAAVLRLTEALPVTPPPGRRGQGVDTPTAARAHACPPRGRASGTAARGLPRPHGRGRCAGPRGGRGDGPGTVAGAPGRGGQGGATAERRDPGGRQHAAPPVGSPVGRVGARTPGVEPPGPPGGAWRSLMARPTPANAVHLAPLPERRRAVQAHPPEP